MSQTPSTAPVAPSSSTPKPPSSVILLGGSFDPVHRAHIALAEQLAAIFNSPVTLLPAYLSPLKSHTYTESAQRLHMLQLAISDCTNVHIDTRELAAQGMVAETAVNHNKRAQPSSTTSKQTRRASYTIDTLRAIRGEIGVNTPLCFVMGMDSFNSFDRWKDWKAFLPLCHLVIADRADVTLTNPAMASLLSDHQTHDVAQLRNKPAGHIWHYPFEAYKISSTEIRQRLSNDKASVTELLDSKVRDYIHQHQLYT